MRTDWRRKRRIKHVSYGKDGGYFRYMPEENVICTSKLTEDDLTEDDLTEDDLTEDDLTEDDLTEDDFTEDVLLKDDLAEDALLKDALLKDKLTPDDIREDDLITEILKDNELAKNDDDTVFDACAFNRYTEKLDELKNLEKLEKLDRFEDCLKEEREIMELFYKEYKELKKNVQKGYLMNFIRLRESMLKDLSYIKGNPKTVIDRGYRLLNMYINEITEVLENAGVEIYEAAEGYPFEAEIHKPIQKIDVNDPEKDRRILVVYGNGYKYNNIVLKKIDVTVLIYSENYTEKKE